MRPVSDRFLPALAQAHGFAVGVTVLPIREEIPIIGGSGVSLDANAAVRASLDIAVVGEELIPKLASDALAPYGNEIQIKWTLIYPDGTREDVSIGVFGIQESDVEDSGDDLPHRLTLLDRAARVIEATFEEPYQVASGTNAGEAILDCLQEAWPDIPHDFTPTAVTLPLLLAETESDRWDFCQAMAEACGMRLYFDGDGICVLRPVPRSASSVWELAEGPGGTLVTVGLDWSSVDSFNKVIVEGDNTDLAEPVRGEAVDDDPMSLTRYGGPFGKRPRPIYRSPYITTSEQAADVAANILAQELGTTQRVRFTSLINPALEPDDAIRGKRERIGLDQDLTVETLQIPLDTDSGTMSGTTKALQVVS